MDTIGYCIRVQALETYREKIIMMANVNDYRVVFAVKHTGKNGNNEHYHIVVVTSVLFQAFRVRMKKIFDKGNGNEHMSLKRFDGDDKAFSYCYHESGVEAFVHKGISDDQIARYKALNDTIQVEVKKAKAKASWTLEEELVDRFKGKGEISEWTIAETLVRTAFERGKYIPNPYLARQIIANVRLKLCEGDYTKEEKVIRSLVERILPNY